MIGKVRFYLSHFCARRRQDMMILLNASYVSPVSV